MAPGSLHSGVMTGLVPSTRYHYRVGDAVSREGPAGSSVQRCVLSGLVPSTRYHYRVGDAMSVRYGRRMGGGGRAATHGIRYWYTGTLGCGLQGGGRGECRGEEGGGRGGALRWRIHVLARTAHAGVSGGNARVLPYRHTVQCGGQLNPTLALALPNRRIRASGAPVLRSSALPKWGRTPQSACWR